MVLNKAVIGLGFGDEGKGLVTNYLCLQDPDAIVIRYSGGQQAGHTVVKDDMRHVFSNFGSGTLNGNPTYWSPFCTLDPIGVYQELQKLLGLGVKPRLFIDQKCPVTTPMDKIINQKLDFENGTCGSGVWRTIERERLGMSLLYEDLYYPTILKIKLELICKFYQLNSSESGLGEELEIFLYCVKSILDSKHVGIVSGNPSPNAFIFEGSQGLMLDQNFGFQPHVTGSNVGSKNIMAQVDDIVDFYLVTRAYQTRHGNGPMTNEHIPHNILSNPLETNVLNAYQGVFRRSLLDLDLLKYALMKDELLRVSQAFNKLVITCLDHVQDDLRFTHNGEIVQCTSESDFIDRIADVLNIDEVFISKSDKSEDILKVE